jgi:hypothetical protein
MTRRLTTGSRTNEWNEGDTFCALVIGGMAISEVCILLVNFVDGPGSAADWVAALAACAAVVFAAIAARAALRGLSIERARDIARDEQDRRQQAELISGWVSEVATAEIGGTPVGVQGWTVTLRNGSPLPVFRLRGAAYYESPTGERDPSVDFSAAVLAPGDTPSTTSSVVPGAYMPVGQFGVPIDRVPEVIRVDLLFTDHRGTRWHRRGDGVLELHVGD